MLTRYADTLDRQEGEALKEEIRGIQFKAGTEICVAVEGERAFARAGISHLYADLASRVFEFIRDEDIQALASLE